MQLPEGYLRPFNLSEMKLYLSTIYKTSDFIRSLYESIEPFRALPELLSDAHRALQAALTEFLYPNAPRYFPS